MGSHDDHDDERYLMAKKIAFDAGCIQYCERHDDIFYDAPVSRSAAYSLGLERLTSGELGRLFDDFDDLKSMISLVLNMAGERCELCSDPD